MGCVRLTYRIWDITEFGHRIRQTLCDDISLENLVHTSMNGFVRTIVFLESRSMSYCLDHSNIY